MRTRISVFIAALFTVIVCTFGGIDACAMTPVETDSIIINCRNEPEGTAFVDVLFRNREKDKYGLDDGEEPHCEISFRADNENNFKELELGKDCGIARYNDGYSSLLFRKKPATSVHYSRGYGYMMISDMVQNKDLFNYYGEFRIAYCDEKGNVLQVTDAVKAEKNSSNSEYHISADGTSLSYELRVEPKIGLLLLILFVIYILLPSILLAIVIKWIASFIRHRKEEKKQLTDYTQDYYKK